MLQCPLRNFSFTFTFCHSNCLRVLTLNRSLLCASGGGGINFSSTPTSRDVNRLKHRMKTAITQTKLHIITRFLPNDTRSLIMADGYMSFNFELRKIRSCQ